MKTIIVVAAIIKHDGKYLCMQRDLNRHDYISYKYEFPGGKVEADESEVEALKREIHEELDIDIEVQSYFLTVEHQYPHFNIVMHSYLCSAQSIEIKLKDHIDYRWLPCEELNSLDWAAADIPIVEKIMKW